MIRLHGRQSKRKRNGHDLSTMEKGGNFPLPHAPFALLACTKSFTTGFISIHCNRDHTHFKMNPWTPPPPPPTPPQFFSVLSIFWPAKKENKGEGIETLHYRLTGLMFLRSITCNSPCFWWPQASVLMFLITNYYLSPAMMSTEDKNWFILYPFNGIHAFNLLLTETRDKLHKYYSNSPLGASFWSRWILYPLSALIRKLYDWK